MFASILSYLPPFFADAASCSAKNPFFGLKPWYNYLPDDRFTGSCDVVHFRILPGSGAGEASDIPLVLLAVVDDLLRIAAVVAVAFVIVGAIQMTISQGNPEQTARAQSTLINALIGLAISIVAVGFVAFLGAQLK
jgi:hypothetical protein